MNLKENLIDLVRCREEIWDAQTKGHKNSELVRRLWEEVASELQVDVETCRVRWKTLQDRCNKERKKKPIGSLADSRVKWPLMQLLEFLLPTMTPRPTISNFHGPSLLDLTGMTDDVDPDEIIIDGDSPEFIDETNTQGTPLSPLPVLGRIRQIESHTGSSSPSSSTSNNSDQGSRRKRGRTNSESTSSDPLEAAVLEGLSAASTRQLTANEHFFLAFGRFADGLSPSAQLVYQEGVMAAYKSAVALDASNKSGC